MDIDFTVATRTQLSKSPTGIAGLDEITGGGFPHGRPTLITGGAGCGKTLLGMEFLVHGAMRFDEPGVFMAFEETAKDLTENVASLGYDLNKLTAQRKLVIDHVRIERSEIEQSGEFDLEGLFIRLGHAIDSIGAKRVVLDTMEALFAGLPNPALLRGEFHRLFRWLKDRGVTAVITAERGSEPLALTRNGLEEFVSDCVIALDHRVVDMVSCRRLRIVKYRGSTHGTNEYPFLIEQTGFSVLPITALGLKHLVSTERIPTGVAGLDDMLGGKGFFRASSVLVSGTAGTGKSSLSAHFTHASCARGERVLYFAFEESGPQIVRNMRSIGIDLGHWIEDGLLKIHASRPTLSGLEMHLATMMHEIAHFKPAVVIVDPINSFVTVGNETEVKLMLLRVVDALKAKNITGFFTSLTSGTEAKEQTDIGISSLIDTWLLVRDIEAGGERNRGLYVLKSRGMRHSNQIREFSLTNLGIVLREAYVGPLGVLTGSARLAQEAQEAAGELQRLQGIERKKAELAAQRIALEAQIRFMQAEFAAKEAAESLRITEFQAVESVLGEDRDAMAISRRTVSQ